MEVWLKKWICVGVGSLVVVLCIWFLFYSNLLVSSGLIIRMREWGYSRRHDLKVLVSGNKDVLLDHRIVAQEKNSNGRYIYYFPAELSAVNVENEIITLVDNKGKSYISSVRGLTKLRTGGYYLELFVGENVYSGESMETYYFDSKESVISFFEEVDEVVLVWGYEGDLPTLKSKLLSANFDLRKLEIEPMIHVYK